MEAWSEFVTYDDAASAEVVAGLLRTEGIPVRVASDEPMPGLTRGFTVMVPPDKVRRAEFVLSQAQLSDQELAYYATGKLDDGSAGP